MSNQGAGAADTAITSCLDCAQWRQMASQYPGLNHVSGLSVSRIQRCNAYNRLAESWATGVNSDEADDSASATGAAYVFARSGGNWSRQAYLKASNTDAIDHFGHGVAISGDTVVVGAWDEDSNATGVNGAQADNSAFESGAFYVFQYSARAIPSSNTTP